MYVMPLLKTTYVINFNDSDYFKGNDNMCYKWKLSIGNLANLFLKFEICEILNMCPYFNNNSK